MQGNHWTFIGGATAVFLAAVYVFWGPSNSKSKSKRKKRRPKGFPGLVNLGNSCYMNVILQSWAACPSLVQWLGAQCTSTLQSAPSLTAPLLKVLKVLNNLSEEDAVQDVYCPDKVMTAMEHKGWVISPGQQDCHELMQALSSTLDEETSLLPKVLSLFDITALLDSRGGAGGQMTAGKTRISSQPLLVLPQRQESPLHGLLASQLQCLTCGHQSAVKYDVFDCITLTLPSCSLSRQLELESLLDHYVRPEVIDNAHCENCDRTHTATAESAGAHNSSSVLQRTLNIGKLPQCLVLHLQRLHVDRNGTAIKRQEHVSFPDILSMDAFLYRQAGSRGTNRCQQRLCGGRFPLFNNTCNSAPVNLLRALNYDSRISGNGLFLRPPSPRLLPPAVADVNHNGPPSVPDVNHNECFNTRGTGQYQYQLTAVISHLGDVQSGHFVTYRRGPLQPPPSEQARPSLPDTWWLASDMCVQRASLSQLMASQAYMLFYERI